MFNRNIWTIHLVHTRKIFQKMSSPQICTVTFVYQGLRKDSFSEILRTYQMVHASSELTTKTPEQHIWNSLKHLSNILRAFLSLTSNMNVAQCFSVFIIDFEQFFYCWISPVPVGKHLFRVNNNDRIKSCSSSWNSSVSSFDGVFYIDDIFPIKTGISVFHAYP